MKIHLEQIENKIPTNLNNGNKSGFVDSRFVKKCDELVIGHTVPKSNDSRQICSKF